MTDITNTRAIPITNQKPRRVARSLRNLLRVLRRDRGVVDSSLPGATRTRRDIGLDPDHVTPADIRDRLMDAGSLR